MLAIVNLLLPLFLLILVGYVAGRAHIATLDWVKILNLFGFYIAFPLLVFKSLALADLSWSLHGSIMLWQLILGTVTLGLTYWLCTKLHLAQPDRNTFTLGLYFSNAGYIGITALQFVFGDTAATEGAVIVGVMIMITLSLGIGLLEAGKGRRTRWKNIFHGIIKNPLLWATLAGLVIGFNQLSLPVLAVQFVSLLAATASPTVLVALGIFMAYNHPKRHTLKLALKIAAGKMIILPAALGVVIWWLPNSHWLNTTFIQSTMPVAITTFALAEVYPMNKSAVSSAIVLSTLFSALVLPFAMWLAPHL